MCEDFVGRLSRLSRPVNRQSRRVNARQHGKNIFYTNMQVERLRTEN
jgi:acyl-CoA thioesterase